MGSSPVYSDSNPRMSLTYTLDTKRPSELKSSQKPSPAVSHIVSVEAQATGRQQAHMGTLGGRRFYEDKPLAGPPPFANTDLPVFSPPHPPNYAPCRPHSHSALHKRAQYTEAGSPHLPLAHLTSRGTLSMVLINRQAF